MVTMPSSFTRMYLETIQRLIGLQFQLQTDEMDNMVYVVVVT